MKYKYFVSYFIEQSDNGQSGFGNSIIEVNKKISDYEDTRKLAETIEKNTGYKGIVIMSFKVLEG